MIALALTAAVVVGDHVALRAAPERLAAQQAVLWKGDWLEVRGHRRGWLEVYDHRHERPGWIAERNVRQVELEDKSAPALRAVVDFVRDTPGSESLGIAYAAMYLKVAGKPAIDGAIMVSLGVMAERLAHRASAAGTNDASASEQLEVAKSWGVAFSSIERDDGIAVCYDGEAFHAALALSPTPGDAATAVLALTDPTCTPPRLGATERQALDEARLAGLDRVGTKGAPPPLANALRIRRAALAADLAWTVARRGDAALAATRAAEAMGAFVSLDRAELAEDDVAAADAAALQVAAARWAGETAHPVPALGLKLDPGQPGETCVSVAPKQGAASTPKCTFGQVWPASFSVSPDRRDAVVAVEPLPGWLELWMFRRGDDGGWMIDVLTPSTDEPDLGYVELAGWSADSSHALIVREARTAGALHRSFEAIALGTLAVDKQSATLGGVGAAKKWAAAEWRKGTLALR